MLEVAVLVAVFSLALALWGVCFSWAAQAEKMGKLAEGHGKALAKIQEVVTGQQELLAGTMWKFHERAWSMNQEKDLRDFVRARGMMPFLKDPKGIIHQEIEAVMHNFGCTREEAVNWMRGRFAPSDEINHMEEPAQGG